MMEPTSTLMLSDGLDVLDMFVRAGMTQRDVEMMRKSRDNALAGKMLNIARIGYESIDERFARQIMGNNIFGRDEWSDASTYGANFTSKQSRIAAKFPYSEALLDSECPANPGKAVSETHFAFLGMDKLCGQPLTIMQWQQIHPADSQPRSYNCGNDCWYLNEQFAVIPLELKWYLGLKEIVQGSPNTSWDGMQPMVYDGYRVPSPVEELTKDFLHYQKFKVYPNICHYAATDTPLPRGYRVMVGSCDDGTVGVGYWDGLAGDYAGLGLFRK